LTAFFNAYVEASEGSSDITIDLDSLSGSLTNNSTAWIYSEEKQQNLYRCDKCHVGYDILGEYAGCPSCGRRNYMHVFGSKIGSLEKRFQEVDEKVSDRHEREVEWERLIRCVSEFEAMANDLRNQLLLIPAAPRRKSDLQSLSFQNIKKANDCIGRWFGFEILEGLSVPDRDFLNIMFNRRHVFTHNAGRVDQEYIDNTGDTKLRLNQLIRLRSQEVKRLLPLIRGVAEKLVLGFESIR
jgi:predicted  nucleic acid-binding Zn-ribbon protein